MHDIAFVLLSLGVVVTAVPNPLVAAPSGLDINNPSDSDPTSPPSSISFPTGVPPNPYPSGIPTQPDQCDGQDPSEDCFNAMAGSGGYLWFDKDSQCSDDQKATFETAVWDATTLAFYSSNFPNNGDGTRGQASGIFYIGPDFASQQNRIAGNLKRAWQFKTPETSAKEYITASCKDTKNLCNKKIGGKGVGGYAWTYSGWFAYYHYITFCPPFFTLDSLSTKLNDVEQDLASGSTKMASDMVYLQTTGQFFLHELMHTRIANSSEEPHIIDEYVAPIPAGEKPGTNDIKAYGPRLVHNLAKRSLNQGGGATRASTNADSYAMLANAAWWWDTTGYFPGVPGRNNPNTAQDDFDDDDFPAALYVDLDDDGTTPSTADFTTLFTDDLEAFGNGPPDPDDQVNTTTTASASPTSTPSPSSTAAPPPPPYVTGQCSFHLTETQDCVPDSSNLFAVIKLKDGAGNDIGDTSVNSATDPIGEGINNGSPYSFTSKLPNPLVVTGEHENDYIQFTYGGLSWQSKASNGGAYCNNGGWDPRDGPICGQRFGNQNAVNNMDCFFPC